MTVLVQDMAGAGAIRDRLRGALRAEVVSNLASVETLWRRVETAAGAVATPYQRFDWVAAFVDGACAAHVADADTGSTRGRTARRALRAEAASPRDRLRIMVLRDGVGRPQILIPLHLSRRHGICVARVVGLKHANFHMPLFASRQAAAWPVEEVEAALMLAGRDAGIDAYALDHQPRFWDGIVNPLGLRGRPCASDAYGLLLGPDPEATLKRAFSADARKKLRAKERKLVEALGPVEHKVATQPDAIAGILAAFHEQKQARFAAMGIPNPFAEDGVRRFVERATARGGAEPPAIELHALVARNGGRIIATFGGAVNAERFSGMWTSFDTDPDLARHSPGDLLLHRLIAHQTAAGRRALDLGVGEARYKSSICDETIELVETTIPVTLRGHLYALGAGAAGEAKRRIKRSPRLRKAVQRLRRASAG